MLPAPITKVIKIYLVYLVSNAGSVSVNFVQLNFGTKILTKGQIISKGNCQAVKSSKKQTNEFVFTTMQCFCLFLEEIEGTKKTFRN